MVYIVNSYYFDTLNIKFCKGVKPMSSINSLGNSLYGLYLKNSEQYSNTQSSSGISNYDNNDSTSLDSVSLSEEGLQLANNSAQNSTNPLNSLVSNGTMTQAQADTVNSAFQAALQFNLSGSYSSTPFNPIKSLVNNGTITQAQATAITNVYLSAYQSNQTAEQTPSTNASIESAADSILGTTSSTSVNNAEDPLLDIENSMYNVDDPLLDGSDSSDNMFNF